MNVLSLCGVSWVSSLNHEMFDAYPHAEICNDLVPQHIAGEYFHIELLSDDPPAYLKFIANISTTD